MPKLIILNVPFIVYKYHQTPVDPNPPSPLSVFDNSLLSTIVTCGWGNMTI
jgi:hypothetical protein